MQGIFFNFLKTTLARPVSPWSYLVVITLGWKLFYAYWTPVVEQYVVPPGDDAAFHIEQMIRLLTGHWDLFGPNSYPLGFHIITVFVAKLFGFTALQASIWIAPVLLVLPIPVLYIVGKRLSGSEVTGSVAAFTWGFLALGPVRAYGDGNYPNLLAASVLLPLAVLMISQFVTSPSRKRFGWSALLVIAIAFTHHLSLIFLAAIVVPWIVLVSIDKLISSQHTSRAVAFAKKGLGVCILIPILLVPFYSSFLAPIIKSILRGGGLGSVYGHESVTVSWMEVLDINNGLLVVLGLVALIVVLMSEISRPIKLLLSCWTLVFIALSVAPVSALPGRFVRELAIPFSLSVGFMGSALWHVGRKYGIKSGALFIILGVILSDWLFSFGRPFGLPDPFAPLVRVHHKEEAAYSLLEHHTSQDGVIYANNSNPYLPFLVDRRVVVLREPNEIYDVLRAHNITTVYVGAQADLGQQYPYYNGKEVISKGLSSLPHLTLLESLPTGSKIYRIQK